MVNVPVVWSDLVKRGFSVAARPRPAGLSIRGSPLGSQSAAQEKRSSYFSSSNRMVAILPGNNVARSSGGRWRSPLDSGMYPTE